LITFYRTKRAHLDRWALGLRRHAKWRFHRILAKTVASSIYDKIICVTD
jgi:hypothetical protein